MIITLMSAFTPPFPILDTSLTFLLSEGDKSLYQ